MNLPSPAERASMDSSPLDPRNVSAGSLAPSQVVALILSWTAVGIPLAWGVIETLRKALALFQ